MPLSAAEASQPASPPPSAFSSVLSRFGELAARSVSDLLETAARGEIAKLQARQDVEVQRVLDEAGRTNDPADADKAAVEQTELLFGFIPVRKSVRPIATAAFVVIGIIVVFALVRSVRK